MYRNLIFKTLINILNLSILCFGHFGLWENVKGTAVGKNRKWPALTPADRPFFLNVTF